MDFGNIANNLLDQMTFFHLEAGNYIMIVVALVFLYLAIKKGPEPLLLIPITFGILLINIYPDIMCSPEKMPNETGGLLRYLFQLDGWNILPSLIFPGAGAMTDFGPLVANPIGFLTGAAAQLGIYLAYFFVALLGSSGKESAAISIIDGAGGPTPLPLCGRLGQTQIVGPIVATVYFYVALVPIIQPPFTKLLTTERERKIKMGQLRPVFRLGEILFPIIITIIVYLILPSTAPLVGMLMLGNLFRESGVVKQLANTAGNALMYTVVILLGTSVGTTTSAKTFLDVTTVKIVTLGLTAFIFSTVGGMFLGKLLCEIAGGKADPLIGSTSVSVVPMATRVSRKAGAEADPTDFLLMHTMGSNVAGITDTAVAAGTFMAISEV